MSLTMMDLPVGNSGHPHPLMHMVCLHLFRHNDCTKACKQMNLNECIKSMSERDRYLMDAIFYEGLMIGQSLNQGEMDSKYLEQCKAVYSSYEQIVSKVHSEIAAFRNYFENKTLEPLILLLRCIYRRFPHLGPLMYSHFTSAAEMALSSMTQDSLAEWCQTFKSRRLYLDSTDNFARRDMQLIVKSRLETPESALQMILEDMQAERKYDDFVVPDKATAASIIGRLGERVMKLRNDHCCYIESPPADTPEDGPRHFRITGPKDNRERVIKAMHEIVQRHRCSPNGNGNGSGSSNGTSALSSGSGSLTGNGNGDNRSSVQAGRNGAFRDRIPNTSTNNEQFSVVLDEKFWVRRSQCGLVIGTNGATVRAIQELTHTVIQSPEKPREPPSLEEMACFRVTYRIPKDGSNSIDQYSQSVREHARVSVNRAIAFMIIYIQHTNQHSNTDVTALVDEHYSLIEHMSDEEKELLYEEVHIAQAALGQRDSVSGTEMRTTRASRQAQQSSTTQAQSSISSSQPPSLLQQQQHFFSDFRAPQPHVQQLQRQKQRQLLLQHHSSHSSNGQPESLMHCDFSLPDMPMSPARSVGCLESRGRLSSATMESWSLLPSDRVSSSYRGYDHTYRDHHSSAPEQAGNSMRQRCASGNIIFGSSHPSTTNSGFNHVTGFSGTPSISHCSSVSRLMGVESVGVDSEGDILGQAPSQSRFFTLGTSLGNGNNIYKTSMNGHDFDNQLTENGIMESGYKQWPRSDNFGQHLPMSAPTSSRQDSRWRMGYLPGLTTTSHQHQAQHQMGLNGHPMSLLSRPIELQLQADEACSNPLGSSDMPSPSVLCPLMKDLNTDDHFGPPINGYSSANGPWGPMSAIGSERKLSISETSDYPDCKFSIMDMSTSTEGSSRKENSPDRELEMQDFASQYRDRSAVDSKDSEGKAASGKNGIVCPP